MEKIKELKKSKKSKKVLRIFLMSLPMIIVLGLSFLSRTSYAEIINTQDKNSLIETTHNVTAQDKKDSIDRAQEWGLNITQWNQYQTLMQGKDGHWYPQLSPPEILGLEAKTKEDQLYFARLVAKEEHDKIARELSFDHQVHMALLALYPKEPIIKRFDLSPFNPK